MSHIAARVVACVALVLAALVGVTSTSAAAAGTTAARDTVFVAGNVPFLGSTGDQLLNAPLIDVALTPTGKGYWLLAGDGGIFSYGDAGFFGSTGAMRLNSPVVSFARTPSGDGYWLVAADGGVFTFGDAGFFGSAGATPLVQPIVGIVPTTTGRGYHLVAADGGVFTYGDAKFLGSLAGQLESPAVAIAPHPSGEGYAVATRTGEVHQLGFTAQAHTSCGRDVVDIQFKGDGYWLLCEWGSRSVTVDVAPGGRAVAFAYTPDGFGRIAATSGPAIADPVSPFPGGAHSFVETRDGRPSRWDPCRVTRWWFDPLDAPPGAEAFVREGVEHWARLLGLPFEYAGQIDRDVTPSDGVVIAFAALDGPAGVAGHQSVGGRFRYGVVVIDAEFAGSHRLSWNRNSVGQVLLHELGHLAGLGHVDDASQLMHPFAHGDELGYEDGDLAGLFQLSAWQGCVR